MLKWIMNKIYRSHPDWVRTNKIIKYTIKHGKYLDVGDDYYIEKFTDDCMLSKEIR